MDEKGHGVQSEEENRAEAERNKRLRFCDRSCYGKQACREWKRQLDSVPLTPDAKVEVEMQHQEQLDQSMSSGLYALRSEPFYDDNWGTFNENPEINDNLPLKPINVPRTPEETISKPGSVSPRLPLGVNPPKIAPFKPGPNYPQLPSRDLPGKGQAKTPTFPSHEVPRGPLPSLTAIGGHTVPPFRPLPQRKH
ncbi:MAG: hypothetical protein Q9210_005985 [Variospora velana]